MPLSDEIRDFAKSHGPEAVAYITGIVRDAIKRWQENRAEAIASIAADRARLAEAEAELDAMIALLPSAPVANDNGTPDAREAD